MLTYDHFNVENTRFPYADQTFDVILFCEIIEHLFFDPFRALAEIHRILRSDGVIVVTTANVARLENVAELMTTAPIATLHSS